MNIKNIKNKSNYLYYISIALLFIVEAILILFINNNLPKLLDSDMSSELVLANILAQENKIITTSWFYSTELRVLNTQLIYSLFFHFTNNWHTVRILSIIVLHLLLFFSIYYLCKQLNCKKYWPLACITVILSFSRKYLNIILVGAYYIPHLIVMFLALALCIKYGKDKSKRLLILLVSIFLSIASGMGGIRQMIITYLPLLIVTFIISFIYLYKEGFDKLKQTKYFNYFIFTFINTVSNAIGFIINAKILSNIYRFKTWSEIRFTDINYDMFFRILSDFLQTLGFSKDYISLFSLISNVVCILLVVVIIFAIIYIFTNKVSDELKLFNYFFISNALVFVAIYIISDMHYLRWYNFLVIIPAIILVTSFIDQAKFGKLPDFSKLALIIILLLSITVRSLISFKEIANSSNNKEIIEIAEYLKDSEYDSGFASFWNSNIMTELTNGKTDMYTWEDSGEGELFITQKNPEELYPWLLPVRFINEKPQGKVFALYTNNEIEYCNWKDKLDNKDIIFKTDNYIVYGYDNYSQMIDSYK